MNELVLVDTYDEDSYKNEMYEYVVDGKTVGSASVMAGETAYVERIDIEEEDRNHGCGSCPTPTASFILPRTTRMRSACMSASAASTPVKTPNTSIRASACMRYKRGGKKDGKIQG